MSLQNRTPTGQEKTIQFAHTAATTAKVPILINSLIWIPINTADPNVLNAFWYYVQASDAPKATGEAWSPGDTLYWDNTNSRFTKTSSGNTKCAHALAAALSADTVGYIDFDTFA